LIKNYINGELIEPVSGSYFDNIDPAIGEAYDIIPDSDERDVQLAVEAAEAAFPGWETTPAEQRSKYMMKIAALMSRDLVEISRAECIDNGKPLSLAKRVDIPRAIRNFEFFASAVQGFASESHSFGDVINYTLRSPIGVVGAISPWNLPLYLFTWKIAPALATGNCVIAKPSEITPMTAHILSELSIEAGLPKGVLNIVHGYGTKVGKAISAHPKIKAITFTGGTRTGADIAATAAPMFKKLSLELGGKNPNIIFADVLPSKYSEEVGIYDEMLETTVRSSFQNQGEICLCGSRIFIQKPLYEKFKEDFVKKVKELQVGDPLSPDTDQGAVVSKQHFEKILYYLNLANEEGGSILCGGNTVSLEGRCSNGWFIEPTVIESLPYNCRTNQEEIFGPVVTLIPFETEEEVLVMANSTEYGLASIIWTLNVNKAHRMAARIQTGIVWVNCWMERDLRTPFGGMKNSGLGREGGMEALRFFTEPRSVSVKII
jgi:aminomuconate-semialdehyde/2-hydroxymuconate-6-semialdehyde dehydrogenase